MVGVEKVCPCGLGSCLVLTANTERNRGRKFCRCPNRQYRRIYSPISFGKKHDPNGDFIRHFLPVLKDMPKHYIYEPWTAPKSLQVKAKCIIGKDYPSPVVSHGSASKECKRKLAEAYALNCQSNGVVSEDDLGKLRRKLEEDQQTQKSVLL